MSWTAGSVDRQIIIPDENLNFSFCFSFLYKKYSKIPRCVKKKQHVVQQQNALYPSSCVMCILRIRLIIRCRRLIDFENSRGGPPPSPPPNVKEIRGNCASPAQLFCLDGGHHNTERWSQSTIWTLIICMSWNKQTQSNWRKQNKNKTKTQSDDWIKKLGVEYNVEKVTERAKDLR